MIYEINDPSAKYLNETNDLILNLTPKNITQHSRIEEQLHTKEAQHPLKWAKLEKNLIIRHFGLIPLSGMVVRNEKMF